MIYNKVICCTGYSRVSDEPEMDTRVGGTLDKLL
jgi:hypothetical protein